MTEYAKNSINNIYSGTKDKVEKIFNSAFAARSGTEFSYRPITMPPYSNNFCDEGLNFAKLYPEYEEGDYVYIQCCMDGMYERDMMLLIQKTSSVQVYFNGEKVSIEDGPYGKDANVHFKEGRNHVLLRVTAEKASFAAYVLPVVPGIRYVACGEYQYRSWPYVEKKGAGLVHGFEISRLYKKDETSTREQIDWVYPIIHEQCEKKAFDFFRLCTEGKAAYAYTRIKGKLEITHASPIKIFADGEEIYNGDKGMFNGEFEKSVPILIKSVNNGKEWGFKVEKCEETSLPFIEGSECPDLTWLWIGSFGDMNDSEGLAYAPEINLFFNKPYPSVSGESLIWRFYREKTYINTYNHTAFFGQWYYAIMVSHYGMLLAAKKLGRNDFFDFFTKSIGTMCKHRDYSERMKNLVGQDALYLSGGMKLERLDPIGTIGMNVAEYYMMTADEDARFTLEKLANAITYNVPRFPDGTFRRGETMWTDDTYMSLPFLVRLGNILGDEKYFDDILNQVRGFKKRMYMEDCDLFSHIFFFKEEYPNRIPWGRGNGWVLLALSDVLMLMPKSYHGYGEILDLYKNLARGVLSFRDEKECLWHQVVNNPESYIEASGSAMFIASLARGIRKGWIDVKHADLLVESWNALCEKCVDTDGNIYGVCKGSGCSKDEEYYMKLGTIKNDDHGVGIVLSAGVEIMNLGEFIK